MNKYCIFKSASVYFSIIIIIIGVHVNCESHYPIKAVQALSICTLRGRRHVDNY